MKIAIAKAIPLLTARSELRLDPTSIVEPKRALPLGIIVSVLLKKSVLFGAVLISIACVMIASSIRNGTVPTFALLLLDRQIAKGVVNSVESRFVTKSKGLREKRWVYQYSFRLPNAQKIDGESWTSSRIVAIGAPVDVEFYPKRPERSRIQGMSASSDENNLLVLGAIVLGVGSIIVGSGVLEALAVKTLLKSGLIGAASVTHCKGSNADMKFEVNGISWRSKLRGMAIPLAEYQRLVVERHRSRFDQHGKFIGTRNLRIIHVLIAVFMGALVFAALAVGVFAILLRFINQWIIIASACFGAATLAWVELRYRLFLRNNYHVKLDELPSLFKNRKCVLEFQALDIAEPVQFEKEMDLKGDTSDFDPRPILYLKNNPAKAKFIDAFELKVSACPSGEYLLESGGALVPLAVFMSVTFVLLACVCVVVATFI